MKKISLVLNLILVVVLGILVFSKPQTRRIDGNSYINTTPSELIQKYPYLSRRVLNENENDLLLRFVPLRTRLREYVAPFGDTFAFYFEYLPTGSSIGVNDRTEFNPASLGKVPLAMAFYLNQEQSEVDLKKMITIKPEYIDNKSGSLWKKGAGAQVSFEEAITIMLEESDNTAARLLADNVTEKDFDDVYKGLDLPYPAENNSLITAKGFGSILKSLYYAAVLNKDNSEKILQLLTTTDFKDKLPAGITDRKIVIAHKIGFWGENLYSDCGIVYIPQRPYLLCAISKTDEPTAALRIKELSQMVYKYIVRIN